VNNSTQAARNRWARPLGLTEVGELTAQWLEGTVNWSPWQAGSSADDETLPLVPYLAAMNRLGYITDFSQPGVPGDQRAAISGFCHRPQAECLASLSLESELVALTEYPDVESAYEIPITQQDERTFTILPGRPVIDASWGLNSRMLSLLSGCYYVSIVDPSWGRDDLLWTSVAAALKRATHDCAGGMVDHSFWERADHPH
jgi:hypothetical protein